MHTSLVCAIAWPVCPSSIWQQSIKTLYIAAVGSDSFVSRPCGEFETLLTSQLVGQDLALQQFSDAVCDHLAKEGQFRPLVVSFHGPPGVGKSLLHLLAARALYNDKVTAALQCPGRDCSGYKVSLSPGLACQVCNMPLHAASLALSFPGAWHCASQVAGKVSA